MNWLTKNINELASDFILDFTDFFKQGVINLFEIGTGFAELNEIKGAVNATTIVAMALVVVFVAKEILSTYILETNGDPDGDPFQLLVKASQSICLICCNDVIFNFSVNITQKFATDLKAAATPEKIFVDTKKLFLNAVDPPTTLVNSVFIITFLILTIVLAVKAGFRGVELAFMKILFPIMAIDLITVSGERWNSFFTTYVVTFTGYIFQLLAFCMAIDNYTVALVSDSSKYLTAGAFLIFSINIPKWMEKFAYSSGLSKVARGGFGGVVQLASMLRTIK